MVLYMEVRWSRTYCRFTDCINASLRSPEALLINVLLQVLLRDMFWSQPNEVLLLTRKNNPCLKWIRICSNFYPNLSNMEMILCSPLEAQIIREEASGLLRRSSAAWSSERWMCFVLAGFSAAAAADRRQDVLRTSGSRNWSQTPDWSWSSGLCSQGGYLHS
ncbi:hypothetical protein CHARACLAT_032446 [Characodon lateralis]|uniref:Uncharacterized protein n=1 Tax=Characodon lateralis TaxID=208331 RepID=A0ABU7D2I3_9TELE|nr:hypothetical protein [Characodon lateralis]